MKGSNKSRIAAAFFCIAVLLSISLFLQSCKKHDQPPPPPIKGVDLKLVADSLVSPLGVVAIPDNSKRMAVLDQAGKIWLIDAQGHKMAAPFMDVTSKIVSLNAAYDERGLLGLAFHPNYKANGLFYIYYTAPPRPGAPAGGTAWDNLSVIAEYKVSADPNVADMSSERRLLELDDPQSNHNGGTIEFGPDGYLYIAIGDGGAANDVAPGHVTDWYTANAGGNGQDIDSNLFGNILRIDVNGAKPYAVPADNPFVGKEGMDEIYAYGFRNPYRFSFDMGGAHKLIAGDAGQSLYEEIDVVEKGGNYGWNVKEGTHCFDAAHPLQEMSACPDVGQFGEKLIDPVIEVNNAANPKGGKATTIIGGNVYRGKAIPSYMGKYIFGTYSQSNGSADGQVFITQQSDNAPWTYDLVPLITYPENLGNYLKGFGQDDDGEIYLTVSGNSGPSGVAGKIFKLVPVQ